jgi:hypothetical protein
MVSDLLEFAEEYSFRERVRLLSVGLVVGGVFVLLWKLWLLPEFIAFAASAHCRNVFSIPGTTVLWYGLCVGLPLLFALVFGCMQGRHGLRILRDGQCPPIGAKVLRRTLIKRGAAARRVGYLNLLVFTPFLAIAIWGFFQAETLSQLKHPACTANYSLKRTAVNRYGVKSHSFAAAAA